MKFNYFWRQVETGDANKIIFLRGGEKPLVFMGRLLLVSCIFWVWAIFKFFQMEHDLIWEFVQIKEYRPAIELYCLSGLPFMGLVESFILGVWMVFGRVTVAVDKTLGIITKDYRVRSFSLYTKSYETRRLSSISFHPVRGSRWILFFYAIYLHHQDDTSRNQLLLAPKKYQKEGRLMAQRIADFLGLPGPAE